MCFTFHHTISSLPSALEKFLATYLHCTHIQTLIFICYGTGFCLPANIFYFFIIEVEIDLNNIKPYIAKKMKSQKTCVYVTVMSQI